MDIPPLRLIVGLGNPGEQYAHTRHNMGVDLLMRIADAYGARLESSPRYFGDMARTTIEGQDLRLLFPTTFMNDSGRSVGAVASFFRIAPQEILVIHDDLDLSCGMLRLKLGGGLAGHNGLRSICAALGNQQNFYRLKIGIGHPPSGDVINWVLGRPAPQDRDHLEAASDAALKGFTTLMRQGLARATNIINGFRPDRAV